MSELICLAKRKNDFDKSEIKRRDCQSSMTNSAALLTLLIASVSVKIDRVGALPEADDNAAAVPRITRLRCRFALK